MYTTLFLELWEHITTFDNPVAGEWSGEAFLLITPQDFINAVYRTHHPPCRHRIHITNHADI